MSFTTDSLAFRVANTHVQSFQHESELMVDHHAAMDCRDCETFLQLGIDAFDWLVRADKHFQEAVCADPSEYDPAVQTAIQVLFSTWLNPCKAANEWVAEQLKRGFKVDNLREFRKCEKEVRAIVASFSEDDVLPEAMRELCDTALDEHRNGETAEFV